MHNVSKKINALLFVLFLGITFGYAQTIKIDLAQEHQLIRGFGGMNHTTWIRDLNEDNRNKSFGNAPGEIGMSILRIHIDPNSSLFSRELPTSLHAIERGAIVFATPWDAPTSLLEKVGELNRVSPQKYGEYVNHLNAFDKYMADNGAPMYAISVQNEPDYGEWTRWTSTEMLNFVRDFAQDINNKVIAPESFQFRRPFSDPILNDPVAVNNVDIIGGHIYGGGLADYPLARTKGKEVWMTEHLLGSGANDVNDWNLALVVGKEINDCMKANFNAYVWWYIRRFYGLITDDGNITDKGYVMSQYSKFIRPGSVRVKTDDVSVSLVDVTAFKTDTSFVMVVVNRNNNNVDLSFQIDNSNVGKLTKFTSSATKKLVNEGESDIDGNTFSATVDARSVTTFTSYAGDGGKQNNLPPVAFAGDDLNVDDTDGLGFAVVTLDGSASTDSDGHITNYSWSLNGQQVAWTALHELTIDIGEYELVLTVTDNDGATAMDTIKLVLSSDKSNEIWLEAECGIVGSNWQLLEDAGASNGWYVETKNGVQSLASASDNPDDLIHYSFTTSELGNFKVWGRVITPTPNDDSYWVKVDDNPWINWNSIPSRSTWGWDDLHDQVSENVVFYELEPGDHTLWICMREDGAKLDKILIANTGLIPSDLGGEVVNPCEFEEPVSVNEAIQNDKLFKIYPNPSDGHVRVGWSNGFKTLTILNQLGQSVFVENYTEMKTVRLLNLDLKPGVYLIMLQNGQKSGVGKLIIR